MWHWLKLVVERSRKSLIILGQMLKILLKRRMTMIDMYIALIIAGRRTLDQVPYTFHDLVAKDLKSLGLDEYGKPLEENAE